MKEWEKNIKGWIFLSHSSKDYNLVKEIRDFLENNNFNAIMFYLRCFDKLKNEDILEDLLKCEIDSRDIFVLCESKFSEESDWVKRELEAAIERENKLFVSFDLNGIKEIEYEKLLNLLHLSKIYIILDKKLEKNKKINDLINYLIKKGFIVKKFLFDEKLPELPNDGVKIIFNSESQNIEIKYNNEQDKIYQLNYSKIIKKISEIFRKKNKKILEKVEFIENKDKLVENLELENKINSFLNSDKKILLIEGESGVGKSYYLQYITYKNKNDKNVLFYYIHIPSIKSIKKEIINVLSCFYKEDLKIVFILDDLHIEPNLDLDISRLLVNNNIKFILSIRQGYRQYLPSNILNHSEIDEFYLTRFNEEKIKKGMQNYNLLASNISIYDLPIFFKLCEILDENNENKNDKINCINYHNKIEILNDFTNKFINDKNIKKLKKILLKMYKNETLIINENLEKDEFNEIFDFKIYSNRITFKNEIIGEFLFAKYILEFEKLDDYLDKFKKIKNNIFKVFFLNSIRFLIALQTEEEIIKLLNSNDIKNSLAKEALSEKRKLSFNEKFLDDPFLIYIMLLDKKNFEKIYSYFTTSNNDYTNVQFLPFHAIANKEKKIFEKFLLQYMNSLSENDVKFHGKKSYFLFALILLNIAYNGFNEEIMTKFKDLIKKSELTYEELSAKIITLLKENYKFLFYGSNNVTENLEFFCEKKFYFEKIKKLYFRKIEVDDFAYLIREDMISWTFAHIIFLKHRDIKILKKLFFTNDKNNQQRYQDFVITTLGHITKIDKKYCKYLKYFTYKFKKCFPNAWFNPTIGSDEKEDSQYDPMIPLISSNIFYIKTYDLNQIFENLLEIKSKKDAFNIKRLLYKLAFSYPELVLKVVFNKRLLTNKYFEDYKDDLIKILNVIRFFYPYLYWREAIINIDYIDFSKNEFYIHSINQIHDWNWTNILKSLNKDSLEKIINNMQNTSIRENIKTILSILLN